MNKTRVFSQTVRICLTLFFAVTVFLPLISMLSKINFSSIQDVVTGPQFGTAARNSLLVTTSATAVSVAIAYLLTFVVNRTRVPCKGILNLLIVLPMLIPSVSHGLGLINVFGNNGIITKALGIESHLYGFTGILLGSVMYSFPVAFLILSDAMKYVDASTYEAAEVLGIPPRSRFA